MNAHLKRVISLGCIVCGRSAVPHHPRAGTASGMGLKAPDEDAIPLCNFHHTDGPYGFAIHKGSKKWEENFGKESDLLEEVKKMLNNRNAGR